MRYSSERIWDKQRFNNLKLSGIDYKHDLDKVINTFTLKSKAYNIYYNDDVWYHFSIDYR